LARRLKSKDNAPEDSINTYQELEVNGITLRLGTEVYHARIIPQTGICYVQTLLIRTIYDNSFVGLDTISKNAQIVANKNVGVSVFLHRADANSVIKEAQKSGKVRKFKESDSEEN
jgi:hypothetical protein